jgi:poly-beta-1,6-N-acetyl-D-glucosamine synthase
MSYMRTVTDPVASRSNTVASDFEARRYVVVSPVRDEEQYIEKTLRSVLRQTIQPLEWIIVDDGSKDNTARILAQYSEQYPWIHVLHCRDRGQRLPGAGVMEAFYAGFRRLKSLDWDFVVKLDGDVGLEPDYFEQCFKRLDEDPTLGICGGVMYRVAKGSLQLERNPLFHVRGPIKLYRRACWEAIGGLIQSTGWDTVDEVHANWLGWRTRSFPELKAIHYRPTGAAQGFWRDGVKMGRAAYVCGYHPLFLSAKCIKRLFNRPYILSGVAHAYGFITGYLKRIPRVEDRGFIRYIRTQQLRRLLFMKTIWK